MIYSINEGQQAEEYKARKAKEAEDKKKAEDERDSRRYSKPTGIDTSRMKDAGDGSKYVSASDTKTRTQIHNVTSAKKQFDRELANRVGKLDNGLETAAKRNLTDSEKKDLLNTAKNLRNLAEPAGTKADLSKGYMTRPTKQGVNKVTDAMVRHRNRHPEQYKEGTIFESVEFI